MTTGGPDRRLIDGRFELLESPAEIEAGATIRRARDTLHAQEVALRELCPAGSSPIGSAERLRIRQTAQELIRLQHPHVAAVLGVVEGVDGSENPWVVTELVTGDSLADRLSDGPMEFTEAAAIGRGVLAGLRAAHSLGLRHGDVRPDTVLFRPDGTPVLVGFGLATLADSTGAPLAESGHTAPDYLSPECLRGGEPDPAADLWALGLVLYVAVEGRHPFRRPNEFATVAAVLQEPLPMPLRAGALAPLLTEALAKDPEQRPGAARYERLLAAAAKARPADREEPQDDVPHDALPQDTPPPGYHPPKRSAPRHTPKPSLVKTNPPKARPPHQKAPARPNPKAPPRRRRRGLVLLAVGVVLVTVAGATLWSSGVFSSVAVDCRPGAVQSPAGAGLLTPQGVGQVIAAQRQQLNTTSALSLSVYATHAEADVPTTTNSHLYDEFSYTKGTGTHRPEGTVTAGHKSVDLNSVNWDCIPGLLQKAQDTLNVPHPTNTYVMLEGPDHFSDDPLISVYLSDAYGSGYLKADITGHIQDTYRHR